MSVNGRVFDIGLATRAALETWHKLDKQALPFPEQPNQNPQRSYR